MREEVILELRMQVRRVSQLLARPSHLLITVYTFKIAVPFVLISQMVTLFCDFLDCMQ